MQDIGQGDGRAIGKGLEGQGRGEGWLCSRGKALWRGPAPTDRDRMTRSCLGRRQWSSFPMHLGLKVAGTMSQPRMTVTS